jgi:hypothetical protein
MIQGRGCLRFALKTGECLRVPRHVLRQEFQRDEAVQLYVLSFVHNTHTTTAELLYDAVMGDGLADERVGGWHVQHILGWGQEASQRRGTDYGSSPDYRLPDISNNVDPCQALLSTLLSFHLKEFFSFVFFRFLYGIDDF